MFWGQPAVVKPSAIASPLKRLESKETQGNKIVWSVFVIKSKETPVNRMVRAVFFYQKPGNSRTSNGLGCVLLSKCQETQSNGLGCFFFIKSQETHRNLMVCVVLFLSKVRKLKEL